MVRLTSWFIIHQLCNCFHHLCHYYLISPFSWVCVWLLLTQINVSLSVSNWLAQSASRSQLSWGGGVSWICLLDRLTPRCCLHILLYRCIHHVQRWRLLDVHSWLSLGFICNFCGLDAECWVLFQLGVLFVDWRVCCCLCCLLEKFPFSISLGSASSYPWK